jgi:hypothetical protein
VHLYIFTKNQTTSQNHQKARLEFEKNGLNLTKDVYLLQNMNATKRMTMKAALFYFLEYLQRLMSWFRMLVQHAGEHRGYAGSIA